MRYQIWIFAVGIFSVFINIYFNAYWIQMIYINYINKMKGKTDIHNFRRSTQYHSHVAKHPRSLFQGNEYGLQKKETISSVSLFKTSQAVEHNIGNIGPRRLSVNLPNRVDRNTYWVVPKTVHYIWFYPKVRCQFKFHHYISVFSAFKYIKPKRIVIWYSNIPCGKWWSEVKSRVHLLILKDILPPQTVFGKEIKVPAHQSDVARLDILLKHGGIYMDTDMVALKSWDPLLFYDTTLGAESNSAIANGVIITKRSAPFLRLWRDSYHKFRDDLWAFNSVIMGFRLAKRYSELVHVEWNTLIHPNKYNTEWIFKEGKLWDWSTVHGMHLYYRKYGVQHDLESIKTLNSTLGQVFRLILYNTTQLMN